jgi:hypothetical protein
MCLLAAVLLSLFAAQLHLLGKTAALDPTRAMSDVSLAGLWYLIVCLPLFRFLMFRWIWRISLWCRFLWRLAKLDLHLVPTHPDGAAGLGYLEVVQTHFTALALAISIVVSASFAEEISSGKAIFEVIYPALALTLIADLALIFLPPCVFAFKLRACQEKGLSDYVVFAARYVNDFEKKWLNAAAVPAEPLLGTSDLQSLADLSSSVGIVRNMRWVPVSTRLLIAVVIAALLPMLPLFLFKYPIAELAQKLFSTRAEQNDSPDHVRIFGAELLRDRAEAIGISAPFISSRRASSSVSSPKRSTRQQESRWRRRQSIHALWR